MCNRSGRKLIDIDRRAISWPLLMGGLLLKPVTQKETEASTL